MNNPIRETLVAGVAVLVCLSPVFADDRDDFLAMLREQLATQGSIEVVYDVKTPDVFSRSAVAVDAGTFAFYSAHGGYLHGRNAAHEGYQGEARQGKTKVYAPGDPPVMLNMDFILPCVELMLLRQSPEYIQSVKRDGDNYVVEVRYPNGGALRGMSPSEREEALKRSTTPKDIGEYRLTVDTKARVLTRKALHTELPMDVYTYSDQSPPGFPLRDRWQVLRHERDDAWQELVSVKHHPVSDPALFERSRVEQVAEAAKTGAPPPVYHFPNADEPEPTSIPKGLEGSIKRDNGLGTWRWPLVGGGITLLAVGIIAWKRNRG